MTLFSQLARLCLDVAGAASGCAMSLTDRHFISPFDIEDWLEGTSMRLVRVQSFDYERANGHHMLLVMNKRLNNTLRDTSLPNYKVDTILAWLEKW